MSKPMKIFLIVMLIVLAILVTALMVYALIFNKSPWDFSSKSVLLLDENYDTDIKNINIEDVSSNIYIKESEEDQIHVHVYGGEKEIVESKIEQETLNITKKGRIFCFGFCFRKEEITIYIPKDSEINLNLKTVSGDMEITSIKGNVELKSTSGDIKVGEVENAKITTTSGDIKLTKANALEVNTTSGNIRADKIENSIEAKAVSGNIKINSFTIKEDSHIKTVSGDVTIEDISDVYVETSTTSGDVQIENNNRTASQTLSIRTTSGDIEVK